MSSTRENPVIEAIVRGRQQRQARRNQLPWRAAVAILAVLIVCEIILVVAGHWQ